MMRSSVIMVIRCMYCSLLKGRSCMSFFVRAFILASNNPSSEPGESVRNTLSYHDVMPYHIHTSIRMYVRTQYTPFVSCTKFGKCGGANVVWLGQTPMKGFTTGNHPFVRERCSEPANTTLPCRHVFRVMPWTRTRISEHGKNPIFLHI